MKTQRQKLIKRLDTLWSLAIRARFPRCVVCGGTNKLTSHHCIVRKAQSMGVRWLINNGVTMCVGCHLFKYHGQQSDKVWMDKYISIINDLISADEQQAIINICHRINKFSTADLRELVENYERGEI